MATSASIDFELNRNQVITGALRKIGAFATGETIDGDSLSAAATTLNALVKHLQTSGIHLWSETEGVLWLTDDTYKYPLSGAASNRAALASGYSKTTTSAAAASGATTIVVTSTTGFAASANVGVMLDSGTLFWTTQSGAVSGSTVTLASALTDTVASGNLVFVYTTANALQRPLRVVGARSVLWHATASSQVETPLTLTARLDYQAIPNKAITGAPSRVFYDPQLGTGQFYVWPAAEDSSYGIAMTLYRALEDFDAAANTPDLPTEWTQTLIWNLALELAAEYDVPAARYRIIRERAAETLAELRGWDREPESVLAGPRIEP